VILYWVLHCAVVSALLGAAALVAERVLRGVGRQGRWAWAVALPGSLLLPLAAWQGWIAELRFRLIGRTLPAVAGAAVDADATVLDALLSAVGSWPASPAVGRLLLTGWSLSTGAMVAALWFSSWRLARARNGWPSAEVDGVRVLVSRDVGPAALGVVRSAIVLPTWVLGLEIRARRLILRHEVEHLRAGDPRLLFGGLLLVALMPWNPVLWWQFRRLRLALELDCDSRVLRGEPDARGYGLLLLEVGRRRGGGVLAMAGMAASHSFLERRLRMLGRSTSGMSRARAWGGAGVAALLVLLACEAREPLMVEESALRSVEPAVVAAGAGETLSDFAPFTASLKRPEIQNRREIEALLVRHYPDQLRDAGIGGTVNVALWIDETGKVVRHEAVGSSGFEALDQAALRVAGALRYSPALDGDRRVRVQIVVPVTFRTS
jgi:TonB family protein